MFDTADVVWSCVAEPTPLWARYVENLALSIRKNGGRLSQAPIVACVVGGATGDHWNSLPDLGVTLHSVERTPLPVPATNKLRMFEVASTFCGPHSSLIAVDCDVVVVNDVSEFLLGGVVRTTVEHASPLTDVQWAALYSRLGVADPGNTTKLLYRGHVSRPYYSSGVVFCDVKITSELSRVWWEHCGVFIDFCKDMGIQLVQFADQVAMATAFAQLGIRVSALPVSVNYCTTVPLAAEFRREIFPPHILHYRSEWDKETGFLYRPPDRRLANYVDSINASRSVHLAVAKPRLSRAPVARRTVRRLNHSRWYSSSIIQSLRRNRLVAPFRRAARRFAK